LHEDGFNFDFKWHVSWTRLVLKYFSSLLESRKQNYGKIKEAITSDNFHRQIMSFSHDEVKQVKGGSLFKRMGKIDDLSKRYANLRAQMSLMFCSPGKKLNFVGNDAIHDKEWDSYVDKEIGLQDDIDMERVENVHLTAMLTELHRIYKTNKPFYKWDDNGHDIDWITDPARQVHAYRRQSPDGASVVCVHNFTDREQQFTIVIPKKKCINVRPKEIFNSDALEFGGQGQKNLQIVLEEDGNEMKYLVRLAPLSTTIVEEGQIEIEAEEENFNQADKGIVKKIINLFKKS
jgi:1,4-alpha-glucan branching enzyme